MEVNYFQIIIFILALSGTLFVGYKYKVHIITNFFLGGLILILLCNLDVFGFQGKLDVFSFAYILLGYFTLNISSLLTYLFKDYQQKYFFVFPVSFFIIVSFFFMQKFGEPQDQMFLLGILSRLFLSFFPLLCYTYLLKFKKTS